MLLHAGKEMAGIVVTIQGFRSHTRSRYVFEKHKSTYVCGPNGAGKSDIYYAIRWCLFPKKGEPIHPVGTNATVRVQLDIDSDTVGKMTIIRAARDKDNDIVVTRGDKNVATKGDDAEALLAAVFGTRKLFDMQCNFSEYVNPFVALPAPQKMEVMNEMSGNLSDDKRRLAMLLSEAKAATEEAKINHIKIKAAFDAMFSGSILNIAAILPRDQVVQLDEELITLRREIVECNDQISRRRVYSQKRREIGRQLSAIGQVTREELGKLEEDNLVGMTYQRFKDCAASSAQSLGEHFTPAEILRSRYTQEDISVAQEIERQREAFRAIVRKYSLTCTPEAVQERAREIDNLIASSALSETILAYRSAQVQVNRVQTALLTFSPALSRAPAEELLLIRDKLDNSLQHAVLWHEHLGLERMRKQKGQESKDSLKQSARRAQACMDCLPLFRQREAYESFSRRHFQEIVVSPPEARERHAQLRELLRDMERSRSAHTCPHCSGATKFVSGQLVKYEGQVVQGDDQAVSREAGLLQTLSAMPYPEIPDDAEDTERDGLQAAVSRAESQLQLLEKLEMLESTIKPLPGGYVYIPDAVDRLAELRKVIELRKECDQWSITLGALPVPVVPEGFTVGVVDASRLREERRALDAVSFPALAKSSAAIRAHISHRSAEDQLSRTPKPRREVSSRDVAAYRESLMKREHLESESLSVSRQLEMITYTVAQQAEMEERITSMRERIEQSKHNEAMRKSQAELTVAEDALREAQEYLSDVIEAKTLYDTKSKECVPAVSGRIQRYVNAFLQEIESPVRVSLVISDKIKLQCFKGGVMFGEVTNLSKGERSCVYFAFNVAFALESPLDILIMDEVTDKLNSSNKDKCINLLLAITSFPRNIPREQIEHLDTISQSMKTLVSGHNRKTLMFTDHHHHQGGCDKTIDLTHKAQMQG